MKNLQTLLDLSKYYTLIAVNIFNVIILLLILNAAAWLAIQIYKAFEPSYDLEALQQVYPNMTKADIALLLNETWQRPWQYEPWVSFKERPRTGKFVNISEAGFRHSYRKNLNLNSPGLNIYVFGGSTIFGYGVDDAATIPSHLQKHLAIRYPKKQINVFNFGRAYYYSTQEVALLIQLLHHNHKPAIAIFIDGLNEGQIAPKYSQAMSVMFTAYNYQHYNLLNHFAQTTTLMRVLRKIMVITTPHRQVLNPTQGYQEYLRNKEIITLLSVKYNFIPYFFIQPVPGYHNNFLVHKFSPKSPLWTLDLNKRMQLLDKTVNSKNSFSITNLLQNYPSQPFVDDVHYTAAVCNLIATAIAQKIHLP